MIHTHSLSLLFLFLSFSLSSDATTIILHLVKFSQFQSPFHLKSLLFFFLSSFSFFLLFLSFFSFSIWRFPANERERQTSSDHHSNEPEQELFLWSFTLSLSFSFFFSLSHFSLPIFFFSLSLILSLVVTWLTTAVFLLHSWNFLSSSLFFSFLSLLLVQKRIGRRTSISRQPCLLSLSFSHFHSLSLVHSLSPLTFCCSSSGTTHHFFHFLSCCLHDYKSMERGWARQKWENEREREREKKEERKRNERKKENFWEDEGGRNASGKK